MVGVIRTADRLRLLVGDTGGRYQSTGMLWPALREAAVVGAVGVEAVSTSAFDRCVDGTFALR